MMPQPQQDLRECLDAGFICVRYGRLEVVHHDRQAEGLGLVIVVQVPAGSDPRLKSFERVPRDAAVIGFHRRAAMIAEYVRKFATLQCCDSALPKIPFQKRSPNLSKSALQKAC
jgi:hypothetical protein